MPRPINLSKILARYKSGWIALTPDNKKFLASAKTLKQVREVAKKKGITNPSVFKSPPIKNLFAG